MRITSIAAAILALSAGTNSWAAEPAGRVLAVAGNATIERAGRQIALQAGAMVENGDTLGVGDKSSLQVRFTDESVVALRANSQFRIENYKYEKNAVSDRSLMGLLKGGMRTITGLIGKANNKNYAVQTATATIGIRGTHFSVVSCNNDCTRPDGTPEANGTFGSVTDGRITVSNAAGAREFGQQDSFHVPSVNSAPIQLLAPPAILSDKGAASRGRSTAAAPAQDGEASTGSGRSSGARVSTSPQLVEQGAPKIGLVVRLANLSSIDNPNTLFATAGNSDVTVAEFQGFMFPGGASQTRLNAERVAISKPASDDSDLLNAFVFNARSGAAAISRFRVVNYNAAADAYWYYVAPTQAFGLGTHRAFGDAPTVAMPTAGIAQYNFVGGTTPTDNYGRAGSFSASNLTMNFGSQQVTSQSAMSINFGSNAAMAVSSTYSIPAQSWSMTPGMQGLTGVTIACAPSCTGGTTSASVNGRFTGAAGQGYLLGTQVSNTQLGAPGVSANTGGNVSVYAKQ